MKADRLICGVVMANWLIRGVVMADWLIHGVVMADWLIGEQVCGTCKNGALPGEQLVQEVSVLWPAEAECEGVALGAGGRPVRGLGQEVPPARVFNREERGGFRTNNSSKLIPCLTGHISH